MYRKLPWYGEYCNLLNEKKKNEDDLKCRNRALYEVDELKNWFEAVGAEWEKNHWISFQSYQKGLQEELEKDFTSEIRKSISIANKIERAVKSDTLESMKELADVQVSNHKYCNLAQNVLLYCRIKSIGKNNQSVSSVFCEVKFESQKLTSAYNRYVYHECLLYYVEKFIKRNSLSQDNHVNEVFMAMKKSLSEYYLFDNREVELPPNLLKVAKRCRAIINQRK